MATNVWTGTASALWVTAGNWSLAAEPVATNDVIIPGGTRSIDCNGMTAVALNSIHILDGYKGTIGSSGSPCTGSVTGAKGIIHNGSGKLYFTDDASGVTANVLLEGANNGDLLEVDGTITFLEIMRGKCTVKGASTGIITNAIVGTLGQLSNDAQLTFAAGAGTCTTLRQNSGICIANNVITTAEINGGIFVKRSTTAITTLAGSNCQIYHEGTGTLTTGIAGNQSVWNFDVNWSDPDSASANYGRQSAVTVTSLYQYPGSIIYRRNLLTTVTTHYDRRKAGEGT